MAKKDKKESMSFFGSNTISEDEKTPMPESAKAKTEKALAKKEPKAPVDMYSFDRWFLSTGRPAHHKAGMMAYRPTKGRKPKAVWDRLFADY